MRAKIQSIEQRPVTSWNDALVSFLSYKTIQGITARAIADYAATLKRFFTAYSAAWNDADTLRDDFTEWINAAPIAPDTFNHRLNHVRAFWKYCVDESLQPPARDPFRGMRRRPSAGKFRDIDAAKISELLTMPDKTTWAGLRDYALILFTLDTAARPFEALHITPANVNFKDNSVTITAGIAKTRRLRVIPFSGTTAATLRKFLFHRPQEWNAETPLFASITGRAVSASRWRDRLRKYQLKDGFIFKPYDLRHAACTLHLRAGMNGETLQRLMGHSTPAMTQRYIHLTNDDLKKAQALTSPVELLAPRAKRAPRNVK